MSYIGTQPVPQSLQSRQQFTGDGSTTTFATIGGVELYEDVFLNGVRLSRVDNEYSFDGTTLTITPAPANGDTVSIILRNDHSELIALPITDSQGNNVLSESGGDVALTVDGLTVDGAGSILTNLSIRTTSSPNGYNLHVSQDDSDKALAKFTNTTTGTTTSDGFDVGINAVEEALIFHNENKPIIFGTNGTERMRIDSSGTVSLNSAVVAPSSSSTGSRGINITANGQILIKQLPATESALEHNKVDWSSGTTIYQRFRINGVVVGSISSTNGTSTSYVTSSDYRFKENITEITDGITRIKQLNPSRFNFIADPDITVDGFIAHEVQPIVPEAITGEKDAVNEDGSINPQGIDQSKLVPLLTAALQESIALIESQQSQIDALTARIVALETPAE